MAETKNLKLSASLEDYLETIYNLAGDDDAARSTEIASSLNVTKASVTGALRVLRNKGLVNYKPYESITLTSKGEDVARGIAGKHDILKSFFSDVLGIDSELAGTAACQAEHTLGPEIISKLVKFVEFITTEKEGELVTDFADYCRNKNSKEQK